LLTRRTRHGFVPTTFVVAQTEPEGLPENALEGKGPCARRKVSVGQPKKPRRAPT